MSPDHQVICADKCSRRHSHSHTLVMTTSHFALSYHSFMVERERIWTKASLCKISSRARSVSPARCQVAASPRDDPANISLAADGRKILPRLGHNLERDAHPLKYCSHCVCFGFDPCAPRANVTTTVCHCTVQEL